MSIRGEDADLVDLVVVGSGAVGLTMAAAWGRLNRTGVVVDRQHGQYGLPRAGHIDHEVMRLLQVLEAEGPTYADAYETEYYKWINAEGETLLEFPWGDEGISGWHSDFMQNSAILEASLLERVQASSTIESRPGWQAVAIDQDDDHVAVTVERTELREGEPLPVLTGQREVLRGRYVVACDGANSRIRELMGIPREDLGFNERWLVIDARKRRAFDVGFDAGQVCDPARPTTVLPLGKHHRRWEWHIRPDEDSDDFVRPETGWKLLGDLGIGPEDVTPVRQLVYTFEARIAQRWREGRVFLAGDAAHTMPPFMGQGMCSGMRDAWNLAWKLDLALAGESPRSLLDSYQLEREPHVRDWTTISIESGKIPCITDPEEARARDEKFRNGYRPPLPDFPELVTGLVHRASDSTPLAPAGQLGLQARVRAGDRVELFDRLIPTTGFVLISTAADPSEWLRPDQRTRLDAIGCTSVQIVPTGGAESQLIDVDGSYTNYLSERGVDVVLMRPDFYVFGGSTLVDLPDMVEQLLAQLGRSSVLATPDMANG